MFILLLFFGFSGEISGEDHRNFPGFDEYKVQDAVTYNGPKYQMSFGTVRGSGPSQPNLQVRNKKVLISEYHEVGVSSFYIFEIFYLVESLKKKKKILKNALQIPVDGGHLQVPRAFYHYSETDVGTDAKFRIPEEGSLWDTNAMIKNNR